jgi:hypothetical protein
MFFKTVSYECSQKYSLAILAIKNLTRVFLLLGPSPVQGLRKEAEFA